MQTTLKVGESVVNLEYQVAPQMVVFSHGFGVRRDARSLFLDIVHALPRGWGYVLFDFDEIDAVANTQKVHGFTDRTERLKAVIDWANQQKGVTQVHGIGHSIGALTYASLAPEKVGRLLLLAPPLSLGLRFAEIYTKKAGTKHEGHTWYIPRSDGSTSVIDDTIFAELMSVDAEGELAKLAIFQPYVIILAGADEIIPDADYTELIMMPTVSMESVEKANHDFSDESRADLVTLVVRLLKEPVL